MSVVGDVVLTRGSESYRGVSRAYLDVGDTVSSSSQGGFSCVVNDVFIYAGPDTRFQIADNGIELSSGQVRVLSRNSSALNVLTPNCQLQSSGGLQMIRVFQDGSRICCQHGSPAVWWSSPMMQGQRQGQSLTSGSEYVIRDGQLTPAPYDASNWNIPVEQLQSQGLAQSQQQSGTPTEAGQPAPPISENFSDQPPADQSPVQAQLNDQSLAQDPQPAADQPFDDENRAPQPYLQADQAAADTASSQDDNAGASPTRSADAGASQSSLASLSAALGGAATSFAGTNSGSSNSDANQSSLQGMNPLDGNRPFAGNIHLLTAETRYTLTDAPNGIQASPAQLNAIAAAGQSNYYSIGEGPVPTTQVSTDFLTGTTINLQDNPPDVAPNAIKIPKFDNHVIELDQFSAADPAAGGDNLRGVTGLIGDTPPAPSVIGTTPLRDERAEINDGATFALGEFRVSQTTTGELEFAVRRSDQDRQIIKDAGGNDANDIVTPNTQLGPIATGFEDGVDTRLLPAAPTVHVPVPGAFSGGTAFSQLSKLRRAAATVVLADQLHDLSRATRQTRFVVDGRIVDISGYRKP